MSLASLAEGRIIDAFYAVSRTYLANFILSGKPLPKAALPFR